MQRNCNAVKAELLAKRLQRYRSLASATLRLFFNDMLVSQNTTRY